MNPERLELIRRYYPDGDTKELAEELGISASTLKKLAARYGIRKSEQYWAQQHRELMHAKEEKYLARIPELHLTEDEEAVLVGSLLGDGTLSRAPRSRNAYYREHFGEEQRDYREWKMKKLERLGFKITRYNHLRGPSHPIFTELYRVFFQGGRKAVTADGLKLFKSPLALACLFFDDGTLVVSCSKKKTVFLTPTVTLYTMSFTREENLLLAQHIEAQFDAPFRLKKVPFGYGWCLYLARARDVYRFMKLIEPYGQEIPSMVHKSALLPLLEEAKTRVRERVGDGIPISWPDFEREPNYYSAKEEETLVCMKAAGKTDQEIANSLGRTYWSIVYKASTLRKAGRVK